MIGVASSAIGAGYLALEHPAVAVLSSLLIGFAPLIGLFILLIILILLYSLLLSSVERMLGNDDDHALPKTRKKRTWRIFRSSSSLQLTNYLCLKEHSPPIL